MSLPSVALSSSWVKPIVKAIPHNSAARCAVPFAQSSSCKNLDLLPVNLRFLQANLAKNSLAHRPPHLCGIALSFAINDLLHHFVINNRAAVLVGVDQRVAANIVYQTRDAAGIVKNQFLSIVRKDRTLETGIIQLLMNISFCLRQIVRL